MLNKIFLIRHGQFDNLGHLTDGGKNQIRKVSEHIKEVISNNSKIEIFCSPTARTTESATIISQILGVNYEKTNLLLSDGAQYQMNLKKLFDFVKQNASENLILVTHFDYSNDFPIYFMNNEYGIEVPENDVKKGEGIMIDCIQKKLFKIE